jgi:ABC-type dipeptide/oligopeptide/nickel transport system permease component
MLKSVDEDVRVVDGSEVEFKIFGIAIPFPTRMTVIRLPRKEVWLHSPTETRDCERVWRSMLPAVTLTFVIIAYTMRMTRAAMINLASPYIEMALLRGPTPSTVILRILCPILCGPIATSYRFQPRLPNCRSACGGGGARLSRQE